VTLRLVLTGTGGVSRILGAGAASKAKASRGRLVTGASTTGGATSETTIGALVSKTTRSGHF
jgi:hypothetical protein